MSYPILLAGICTGLFFGIVGYLLFFLVAKIFLHIQLFFRNYIPDLSDLILEFGFIVKDQYNRMLVH